MQHRIACEWYKDARHVDSQIMKLSVTLKKYLGTIGDPNVLGILTEITELVNSRDKLKSVQKASTLPLHSLPFHTMACATCYRRRDRTRRTFGSSFI